MHEDLPKNFATASRETPMGDDRPSIAELQAQHEEARGGTWIGQREAAVLLEIVAAALDWLGSEDDDRAPEIARLEAALAKVRP